MVSALLYFHPPQDHKGKRDVYMKCILQATAVCTKEIEHEYFGMTKQKGLSNKLTKKMVQRLEAVIPHSKENIPTCKKQAVS